MGRNIQIHKRRKQIKNYQLYGGYEEAERKILIIYPEKYTERIIAKNYEKMLTIVRITLPNEEQGKFEHRNYLGGIIKLGLKREKVGDIIVSEGRADIVAISDFANILKDQLPSLTRFQNAEVSIDTI